MTRTKLHMGIDIGSTTAKIAILDQSDTLCFSAYRRHKARIIYTLIDILKNAQKIVKNSPIKVVITGSAGMGIAEKFGLSFVQEVVASAKVVKTFYPDVTTLIDIGGEDAKMIFFNENGIPDMRMNGSCAGGTGAFIDEMASLLNISVEKLSQLAENHTTVHPIASRCGVFAKTDVQNLISREISREDIAASIFHALVYQTIASLARGHDLKGPFIFSGGPLTFLPALRNAFADFLQISPGGLIEAKNTELVPAIGAALDTQNKSNHFTLTKLIELLESPPKANPHNQKRLPPLFKDYAELEDWNTRRKQQNTPQVDIDKIHGEPCFLGIDSGSTTSKIILIDQQGRILFDHYTNNQGNPIQTIQNGLNQIREMFASTPNPPFIAKSVVTGYGEDLIRTAFGLDDGMVETLAHYRGAQAFNKDVSFILDIGGQDMKAIFVKDGHIQNIEINEACSSGCGSFIESFSRTMGYPVSEFGQIATTAETPCDMGSRCTVFMNSRVKQALREAAEVKDISAGLAYSVIKNALHKVLKITDTSVLGSEIVVQGGTFRNPAVHKAFENLIEKPVTCPDIAELMGAYGAALTALDQYQSNGKTPTTFIGLDNIETASNYQRKLINCRGCENHCTVTKLIFHNRSTFYTGNRCERIYSNKGKQQSKGANLPEIKYELLFEREMQAEYPPLQTIGIPRVLNIYENFPFWNTLFVECGFKVELSSTSSKEIYNKGAATVMSDNICFPAKMAHGHIIELIEAQVDRIFYPMVFYEKIEFKGSTNHYNCPIVSGYPEVIESTINPLENHQIPFDRPTVTFENTRLLKKTCREYLSKLNVSTQTFQQAFKKALKAQKEYKEQVRQFGAEIMARAEAEARPMVLLMGHPYHLDPHINHKTPNILADFGIDVITEDAIPVGNNPTLDSKHLLTQWEYINRYLFAAHWAAHQERVDIVQLNSFACAPDAISIDEVRSILETQGKNLTVIRIDEIESPGSAKLRLRSMIESKKGQRPSNNSAKERKNLKVFEKTDQDRKILAVNFSQFVTPAVIGLFKDMGYEAEALPPPDQKSVELGLKYANNEICYPCIITTGDIIKALQSGKYDLNKIAVGSFMTGGQCRASCYTPVFKRAMISAGFEDIPMIALAGNNDMIEQPGFKMNFRKDFVKGILGIVFGDVLRDMYYATACREVNKGEALKLTEQYFEALYDGSMPLKEDTLLKNLEQTVRDFNAIKTMERSLSKIGIVGEIYVKYNAFSNHQIANWLIDQNFEVVVPNMLEFFLSSIVRIQVQQEANLLNQPLAQLYSKLIESDLKNYLNEASEIASEFRFARPHHSIYEVAENAKKTISLAHQYGEGWLIAGEIGTLYADDVKNVLCLQPFGCIPNQVVAKGISKRISENYPDLNLLFLDLDASTSEANFFNRMHFFIDHANQSHKDMNLV